MNKYVVINGQVRSSEELRHHGVLGMKWGVRRYQNPDGSLTPLGKNRFAEVSDDDRLSTKQTKQARKIYQKQKRRVDNLVLRNENKAERTKDPAKREAAIKAAKEYTKKSNAYKQRLSDLDSRKIKAGRDFIVQTDYNVWPFYLPGVGLGVSVTREQKVVEKKKK